MRRRSQPSGLFKKLRLKLDLLLIVFSKTRVTERLSLCAWMELHIILGGSNLMLTTKKMGLRNFQLLFALAIGLAAAHCGDDGSKARDTSEVTFHTSVGAIPGLNADTGLQPDNAPVQLPLSLSASVETTVDATAYASGNASSSQVQPGATATRCNPNQVRATSRWMVTYLLLAAWSWISQACHLTTATFLDSTTSIFRWKVQRPSILSCSTAKLKPLRRFRQPIDPIYRCRVDYLGILN